MINKFSRIFSPISQLTLLFLALVAGGARAEGPNPDYVFFSQGDTTQNWAWVLSDPDNWWLPIEGNEGKSKGGKVTVKPTDYQGKGDAVQITWAKSDKVGLIGITGRTTNLAKFEQNAELVIVARVDRKAKGEVKISMECGENCKAEMSLDAVLKEAPLKQWFVIPVALDCFSEAGAKLDNISIPMRLTTTSKFGLSIASVFVQAMAPGDEGCVPNNPE